MSDTRHETNSLFAADKKQLFLALCTLTILIMLLKISFVENETAAFEFLQDRPEGFFLKLIQGLRVFAIPLVLLWKITVIAFVIWVGCFTFGYRVTYWQCWTVVVASEFIFLIPEVLKFLYYMFIKTDPTYTEIGTFYPLSLLTFFDYYSIDRRYAYPLRALNLFEIAYCWMLVKGINHFARKNERYVQLIVLCSYVLIFLLWLIFYIIAFK